MRLKIISSSGNRFTDHYLNKTIIIPGWYVAQRGIPYAKTAKIARVFPWVVIIAIEGKLYGIPRKVLVEIDGQTKLQSVK